MYRKILFPHDGTELSDIAVPHVIAAARAHTAEVVLLHVIEAEASVEVPSAQPAESTLRPAPGVVGNERLLAVAEELRAGGVTAMTSLVVEGPAADTIVRAARELGCDLIVMGTHARSGLTRALAGSVAEQVARQTPGIPVLLVSPPEDEVAGG